MTSLRVRAYILAGVCLAVLLPVRLFSAFAPADAAPPLEPRIEDFVLSMLEGFRLQGVSSEQIRLLYDSLLEPTALGGAGWRARIARLELGLEATLPEPTGETPTDSEVLLALYEPEPRLLLGADRVEELAETLVPHPFLRSRIESRIHRLAGQTELAERAEARAERRARSSALRAFGVAGYFVLLFLSGSVVLAIAAIRRAHAPVVPVSLADGVGVFAIWLLTHLLLPAVLLIPIGQLTSSAAVFMVLSVSYLLAGAAGLLLARAWVARPSGLSLRQLLGLGRIRTAGVGIAAYGAVLPLLVVTHMVSQWILPIQRASGNPALSRIIQGSPADRILVLLLVTVAAPVVEETMFRGVLLPAFLKRLPPAGAILLNGALFSLVHMDLPTMIPLITLGSTLAYVRYRTGSVIPSMVTHGLWNLQTFGVVLLLFA